MPVSNLQTILTQAQLLPPNEQAELIKLLADMLATGNDSATGEDFRQPGLIELDERGVAWITGANTKVIEVALDKIARDWSPEEMHRQHPHLSLAQIYAALAYYYEHQAEIDAEIERQVKEVEALAEAAKDSPGRRRLRAMGLLP